MSSKVASDRWLSLAPAAGRLGVHPTTLRRWADQGEIKVMLTPGGHRRFLESDLQAFEASRQPREGGVQMAAAWAEHALQTTRREISRHEGEAWLGPLDSGARDSNRRLGQRLLGLTMQYISATDDELPVLQDEARGIGRQYGEMAHESGLPLLDALEAALFFRDLLLETALQLPETTPLKPPANMRLMRKINTLLNTIQLQIAEVYDGGRPDTVHRG